MTESITLPPSTPSTTPTSKSNPRDRDSGVFLSDTEDHNSEDNPTSTPPPVPSQASLKRSASTATTTTTTSTSHLSPTPNRLHILRPTGLNLSSTNPNPNTKPTSSQPRVQLKSPNSLLRARLNLSPKKEKKPAPIRNFIPPRPVLKGCIMPAPQDGMPGFRGTGVTARTERGMKAWWCRVDRVVVFDGILEEEGCDGVRKENIQFLTRSCKGLSIARRRGDTETLVIPLDCAHCRDMFGRAEWKYDVRVCRRSVCWECRERCMWEWKREKEGEADEDVDVELGLKDHAGDDKSVGRDRTESVLQDPGQEECLWEDLNRKAGIETEGLGAIEVLGGIDERLEGLLS